MGDDPSNKGEDDPNPISVKDIQVAPTQAALQTHLHAPRTSAFRLFICDCQSRPWFQQPQLSLHSLQGHGVFARHSMFGTIEVPDQFYDYDKKDKATSSIKHVARRPCDPALVGQEMPANAARNDGKPSFEDPALIKMSNQHTKLGQARSEEPAPTKLNEQDNTHSAPVRALMAPAPPMPRRARPRRAPRAMLGSYSRRLP